MKVKTKKLVLRFLIRFLENLEVTCREALMDLEPKRITAPENNIED